MFKPLLAAFGLAAIAGTSLYTSTVIGIRTEGWHELALESPGQPGHDTVGRDLFTPDGSKVLVTAVARERGTRHRIHAKVRVTRRLSLSLFPTRLVRSVSMDRPAVEWTVLQASDFLADRRMPPRDLRWHELR